VAIGDDRAMMPREGCLLRQNQSPKLTHTFLYLFDARHTPLVRRPSGVR